MGFEKRHRGKESPEKNTKGIWQSSTYLGGTPRELTVWVAVARLCTGAVKIALERGWRYRTTMWMIDV